jgi:2-haloacid dehalogenase
MTLDTVVFDIGGVLVDWDPRHLYRSMFDGDHAEMERFLDEVCTPQWNHAMDAGRPFAEASAELIAQYPHYEGQILAWQGRWTEMLSGSIEGTVEVLHELSDAGVRLLALTNWSAETFPEARRRFEFLARFEAIVVSGEYGLAKPDPALFQVLIDQHLTDPGRAVFVDDRADNVAAARGLGLTGLVFTDPDELRADLGRLGLLPARR